jgi:hypothetical protein
MGRLPCITLWRPWSTWIADGRKTIETRTHDRFRSLVGKRIGITRVHLEEDAGKSLQIAYVMTDPKMWEGEWKSTKWWKRVDDQDIVEVECTPDLDEHLPATQSKLNVR